MLWSEVNTSNGNISKIILKDLRDGSIVEDLGERAAMRNTDHIILFDTNNEDKLDAISVKFMDKYFEVLSVVGY